MFCLRNPRFLLGSVLLALVASASARTIEGTRLISGPPRVGVRAEFEVALAKTYAHPFDSSEVALDAEIVAPSGARMTIPGFLYRPYRRTYGKVVVPIAYASDEAVKRGAGKEATKDRGEILVPTGAPVWRIRFTPLEAGEYRFALVLRDAAGTERRQMAPFRASRTTTGVPFVRIDPKSPRAFRRSDGRPFYPIGANLGWAGERGLEDYEAWLSAYGAVGANWGRVWLSPSWTTFALERPGLPGLDLGNAWRLDQALDLARSHGIYLDLCIDSYNVLRDKVSWPEWDRFVDNVANGGTLRKPSEFWTDPRAQSRYRDKLRYLVARWGADPAVFSWEFWNEVDGVADYAASRSAILDWHRRMGSFLKRIDPYHHLVSTSFGGNGAGAGDAALFSLREIDYSVAHIYDAPDLASAVSMAAGRLAPVGKPFFVAELGADASGDRAKDDPNGLQWHDPLWASAASATSGGAMLWWWDSYIHPRNLYSVLRPFARFMRGVDLGAQALHRTPAHAEFLSPPTHPEKEDLRFEGGPADWSPSPANRPQTVKVDQPGATGGPVAGFLHGVGNHPDLHNPVTFEVNLPWPVRLDLVVGDVSGYGGAALRATLDGGIVVDRPFVDEDADRGVETIKKYAGVVPVEIPAGRHTVRVENPGQDWVRVDYRFENAVLRVRPPLAVWSSVGKSLAIAWVRPQDRTWQRVAAEKETVPPVPPSLLVIEGVLDGRWKVELWDTWDGSVVGRSVIEVRRGKAAVRLPAIATDLAVKMTRTPTGGTSPNAKSSSARAYRKK